MTTDTVQDQQRVAEIARSLTKAQRTAIAGKTRWLTHLQALGSPMCGTVRRMRGLPQKWEATELGLAVRQHLLGEKR